MRSIEGPGSTLTASLERLRPTSNVSRQPASLPRIMPLPVRSNLSRLTLNPCLPPYAHCPFLSFQQLNYPARRVHPERGEGSLCVSFCFQRVPTINFCNSFLLTTIQNARGVGGPLSDSCVDHCKSAPLFSTASTMLIPQPFSFYAFALLPGGRGYRNFSWSTANG
jgi:hypothetical protein